MHKYFSDGDMHKYFSDRELSRLAGKLYYISDEFSKWYVSIEMAYNVLNDIGIFKYQQNYHIEEILKPLEADYIKEYIEIRNMCDELNTVQDVRKVGRKMEYLSEKIRLKQPSFMWGRLMGPGYLFITKIELIALWILCGVISVFVLLLNNLK